MALPNVNIVLGQGGLNRPLPGLDYISGMIFYTDTLPSGFTTEANKVLLLSLNDAIAKGITNDYADILLDEQGNGTITITAVGSNGNTVSAYFLLPNGTNLFIGNYTKLSTDTTDTAIALGLKKAINLLTPSTGFTATSNAAVVTVIYPKRIGIYGNTGTPLNAAITGGITFTVAQDTNDGVASLLIQWYYHIAEYFRLAPQGNLWVEFAPLTDQTWNFAEVSDLQNYSLGVIRQMGIYLGNAGTGTADFLQSCLNTLQGVCATLATQHAPLSVVIGTDISSISDLTTLHDLSLLSDNRCSATLGQDGANQGFNIYKGQGYSITDIGAVLGCISLSAVNESQAWVQKFNMSNGLELSIPAFANGHIVNLISDANLLTLLNNFRYLFLIYFSGKNGTYWNDNHTAVALSSDYAYINDNRVIDKASRNLYVSYLPFLSGTIRLNADGTLRDIDIAYLITLGNSALDPMINTGEISADGITIDPTQKILQTNTLVIGIKIVPDGVARQIVINLGYTQSL